MWFAVIRGVGRVLLIALAAGLIGAVLVRLGPGFGTSEQDLDPRLGQETRDAIRAQNAAASNVLAYYAKWVGGVFHGDLGYSPSLKRPISELFRDRLPLTLREAGGGALAGTLAALMLALVRVNRGAKSSDTIIGLASAVALSLPAAVVALLCFWSGTNTMWAIAFVVFPQALRYAGNILTASGRAEHVLAARARGVRNRRVLFFHILGPVSPQIAALAGMAVTIAFGASIPIEALCDQPGIGQLAWQAALARDLPILVDVTVLVAALTAGASALADIALSRSAVEGAGA
jgi:peptide/nickel transport system permease protein